MSALRLSTRQDSPFNPMVTQDPGTRWRSRRSAAGKLLDRYRGLGLNNPMGMSGRGLVIPPSVGWLNPRQPTHLDRPKFRFTLNQHKSSAGTGGTARDRGVDEGNGAAVKKATAGADATTVTQR
jgi:hypothetical protein